MSKLFVLSVHFESEYWLQTQRRFLDAYIDVPHERIFAFANISASNFLPNEVIVPYSGLHSEGLDLLARRALTEASDDDWLLFLDSDAFPVTLISEVLANAADFTAVQRTENLGDPQPHPCFSLVRAGLYERLNASWSAGYYWFDIFGLKRTDVGAGLLESIEKTQLHWTKLRRVNTREYHLLFFAVYGFENSAPVVYHHGAGSRRGPGRVAKILRRKNPIHYKKLTAVFALRSLALLWRTRSLKGFLTSRGLSVADFAFRELINRSTNFIDELFGFKTEVSHSMEGRETSRCAGEARRKGSWYRGIRIARTLMNASIVKVISCSRFSWIRRNKTLVLVHIGKCGGRSVKKALARSVLWHLRYRRVVVWHTLSEKRPIEGADYVIVVRNPIRRALSAFNYRYSQVVLEDSDPREFSGEREALLRYATLNTLAEALYANGQIQEEACSAYNAIHHLGDESITEYLRPIIEAELCGQVVAVLRTESLLQDALNKMGLRVGHKHDFGSKSVEERSRLSEKAIKNLRSFLAEDYATLKKFFEKTRTPSLHSSAVLSP